MQTIDWLHLLMALLFTATAIQRYKKQGESFFIRLVIGGWFFLTTIFHDLPVELVRNVSSLLIVVMLILEITALYLIRYWEHK